MLIGLVLPFVLFMSLAFVVASIAFAFRQKKF